jgi:hypothetical protein
VTHAWLVHGAGVPHVPLALHVWTPLFEHCFVPGVHTPAQAPFTQAWLVHAAPSCHVPLVSHVCTTSPLHCVAFGEHVPAHAPPLQTLEHGGSSVHAPVGSHCSGEKPLHCRVPGEQPPMQAPSRHTYGQVSRRVVVTRSIPHSMLSVPWQSAVPTFMPLQLAAIGRQDPALPPGVVSQLSDREHLPSRAHRPLPQTSWSFCACPAHPVAPSGEQACPTIPIAVPSSPPPTVLPSTAASLFAPPANEASVPRSPPPPLESPAPTAPPLPPAAMEPPPEIAASGTCEPPLNESSPDVVQATAAAPTSQTHRAGRGAILEEYLTPRRRGACRHARATIVLTKSVTLDSGDGIPCVIARACRRT